jgi:hypothetical protein
MQVGEQVGDPVGTAVSKRDRVCPVLAASVALERKTARAGTQASKASQERNRAMTDQRLAKALVVVEAQERVDVGEQYEQQEQHLRAHKSEMRRRSAH